MNVLRDMVFRLLALLQLRLNSRGSGYDIQEGGARIASAVSQQSEESGGPRQQARVAQSRPLQNHLSHLEPMSYAVPNAKLMSSMFNSGFV